MGTRRRLRQAERREIGNLAAAAPCYNALVQPVVINDYGAGNLRSVQKAFEHLGHRAKFTSNPDALDGAPAIARHSAESQLTTGPVGFRSF